MLCTIIVKSKHVVFLLALTTEIILRETLGIYIVVITVLLTSEISVNAIVTILLLCRHTCRQIMFALIIYEV